MKKILNIPINQDILKIIAIITMTVDHIGYIFPNILFCESLRLLGRLSFPLFVFLLTFNLSQKDLFKKYISRLLSFALISSLTLFHFKNALNEILPLNILWSLLLGVVSIYGIDKANQSISIKFIKHCTYFYIAVFSLFLSTLTDYKYFGLLYILSMYAYFKSKDFVFILSSLALGYAINMHISTASATISTLTTLILLLPFKRNNKQKRFLKPWWLFYAYYPIHLAILYAIKLYW